jgi:hypothetical protein
MAWNSFESVLLTAHTGVAAVNMGGGAATINSIFKLGGNSEDVDLDGDKLEDLVEELSETKLVIIDEISTVGAAQFEMISRMRLLIKERSRSCQPFMSRPARVCLIDDLLI